MTFVPRFKEGDKVKVKGPALHGNSAPKAWREGVVETVDSDDASWPYYVKIMWRGTEQGMWFRDENTQPLIVVPKFTTQAEADAWLEKHS